MYIAIDIGGTNLRVASFLSLDQPQIKDFKSEKTRQDYTSSLNLIKSLVKEVSSGARIEKIGVAVPAPTNLPDWKGRDLKKDLESLFSRPVVIENDAAAAALGEAHYGKSRGRDFLFITLGTGIGGAYVRYVNSVPRVAPAEPGHQIIVSNGLACACGQHGCLEAYYRNNDQDIVAYLAQGLINCLVINPVNLVFMAGGAAVHEQGLISDIKESLHDRLKILPTPEIRLSSHLDKAGIYGALSLLKSTV